jgi:AbrB family looped-hinge helix DNA binding protein
MMNAITSKSQVTIPKAVRDLLGIGAGSRVDFVMDGNGQIVLRKVEADAAPPVEASRFGRFLGTMKIGMTTDQIMALTRGED